MMTLLRHDYIQLLTIDLVLLSCVTTVLQPSHDNKTHSPAAAKGNLCNWSEKFITHAVAAADLWLDIVPALLNFVVNLLMVISRFKESGKRCWAVVNTFWYTIEPSIFCIMSFKKEPEVTETCGHWQALMIGEARIYKNLAHLGKHVSGWTKNSRPPSNQSRQKYLDLLAGGQKWFSSSTVQWR